MDNAKQQLIDKLKTANNVLVSVSRNPSVDQLAALLGLTLLLNKQNKHAAAVFSGQVPSTIEFLQPEETIEKNTDSLRDFIIALDKSKADKLRYKVENDIVRIFITPYKTSITQEDFEFSQGDFNVDVVVALGVSQQDDLDEAITTHGRILHDATVTSINIGTEGGLGTINWHDPQASSLSESVTELVQILDEDLLDEQIATALLTGIVSATDRFSNDKTSSRTMSLSALLMSKGANQQLVATKLEEEPAIEPNSEKDGTGNHSSDDQQTKLDDSHDADTQPTLDDGVIEIDHSQINTDAEDSQPPAGNSDNEPGPAFELPNVPDEELTKEEDQTSWQQSGLAPKDTHLSSLSPGSKLITEPPTLGGTLTANSQEEPMDPSTDPLSSRIAEPGQLLSRDNDNSVINPNQAMVLPAEGPSYPQAPIDVTNGSPAPAPPQAWLQPTPTTSAPNNEPTAVDTGPTTLSDLEQAVDSSHIEPPVNLDTARGEVDRALNDAMANGSITPSPIEGLNAQPLGDELHPANPTLPTNADPTPTGTDNPPEATGVSDPTAPPPVPPPIPFQFGSPS